MAVADATSASGAIATSPARRTRAVRGLTLTTPAQFRLAAAVLVVGLAVLGAGGRAGRLGPGRRRHGGGRRRHADAGGRRGALRRTGRRRRRGLDRRSSRALEPPDLRAKYRTRTRGGERLADQDRGRARPVTRVERGRHPHRRDPAGLHRRDRGGAGQRPTGGSRWVRRTSGRPPTPWWPPSCLRPPASTTTPPASCTTPTATARHAPIPGSGGRRCRGAGPPAGDAGRGDVADQAAPQRGAARRDGAGGSTR